MLHLFFQGYNYSINRDILYRNISTHGVILFHQLSYLKKYKSMKITFTYLLPLIILLTSCSQQQSKTSLKYITHFSEQLKFGIEQITPLVNIENNKVSPRSIENGQIKMVADRDWTSGFFPGELWFMYELTNDPFWKEKARTFTSQLEMQKWNAGTHDMGFKMYCSYGNGYRLTKDKKYREILIQSAKTLCERYNSKVGCIRSWDHNSDKWDYPVIIDNMMNLELLYWASKTTGDPTYKDIATSHAFVTLKNHFREDNSSYHVIDYNPETGEVVNKNTHQGYSHESAWSRGQAWVLYGFTMCYRETGIEDFKNQAEKIADYMINHKNAPADCVPYWDYDAPNIPAEPRDASAAAVMASALYELSGYSANGSTYKHYANEILNSLLSEKYLANVGDNHGFLLYHSTGSKPHNKEVDVPLVYADYYLLEAFQRRY